LWELSLLQQLVLFLGTLLTVLIGIYASNWCLLTYLSIKGRKKTPRPPEIKDWPKISVHVPFYNERNTASRLLEACVNLDYPREKLEIIVIDDSNDGTTEIARSYEARYKDLVKVLHREERDGFKAGALQLALKASTGEFIAIFDADYVPRPNLLKAMVPYLYVDENVAFVQARCGYLNRESSWITKAYSLAIDGYFLIDQRARFAGNLLAHFSGTNGIFRRRAIEQGGGWHSDTLVEDMDLSVRLQLAGWKYIYAPNVYCSGEIPPVFSALRKQQFRWAKGFTECLKKYWKTIVFHKHWSAFQKTEALLQLSTYFIFVISAAGLILMFPYYLLLPISFLIGDYWKTVFAPLTWAFSVAIYSAPLLVYGTAVSELRRERNDTFARLFYLLYLMVVGFGILFSNAAAVIGALIGRRSPFDRTPKFGLVDKEPQT